jgi:Spy/CpxP family protein refolding chaperone
MMRMATVMADVMRFEARHVLAAGDVLELTSAQVRQLERLVAVREAAHRGAGQGMSWTEVGDALDAQAPDTAAVRRAAENTVAHSSALHVRMAVDAAAVKALLSPAQRAKVPAPKGCPALPHPGSEEDHHDDSH